MHEKGTVAAAATAATIDFAEQNTVLIRFDRPFMLAILQREAGCILFLGKVTNPNPIQQQQ